MSKETLTREIAQELLDFDLLNKADYNGDIVALLSDVEEKIMYRLKDYSIVSGEIF